MSAYVTASLGIASITPTSQIQLKELIVNADMALYSAKECGRNQVSVYKK